MACVHAACAGNAAACWCTLLLLQTANCWCKQRCSVRRPRLLLGATAVSQLLHASAAHAALLLHPTALLAALLVLCSPAVLPPCQHAMLYAQVSPRGCCRLLLAALCRCWRLRDVRLAAEGLHSGAPGGQDHPHPAPHLKKPSWGQG